MKKTISILVLMILILGGCKKPEGAGGNSKIIGKLWVKNYNSLNNLSDVYVLKSEYPGADEDVYIIYGDDVSYGDKIKSGPDGTFEFNYLRPGDYKVYVQSKDTTRTSVSGKMAVVVSVNIPGKKKTADAGQLVVYK